MIPETQNIQDVAANVTAQIFSGSAYSRDRAPALFSLVNSALSRAGLYMGEAQPKKNAPMEDRKAYISNLAQGVMPAIKIAQSFHAPCPLVNGVLHPGALCAIVMLCIPEAVQIVDMPSLHTNTFHVAWHYIRRLQMLDKGYLQVPVGGNDKLFTDGDLNFRLLVGLNGILALRRFETGLKQDTLDSIQVTKGRAWLYRYNTLLTGHNAAMSQHYCTEFQSLLSNRPRSTVSTSGTVASLDAWRKKPGLKPGL